MNIGVDIRCLMDKNRTGVGEYTYGLLNAVFEIDKENQYFLFYNSSKDVSENIPKWEQKNVHYVYTKWSNKILNLLLFLRVLKLDNLVIKNFKLKIDIWFSPNLNFTHLSKNIKHLLTIHDLSFEFLPECFTWKQRLWHWFLNPKRQCQKADLIVIPSQCTKNDVADEYGIVEEKIKVLYPGLSHKFAAISPKDSEEVKKKYNLPEKYILFLGTLEPRKNVETIIEAYKIAYSLRLTAYSLVIVGNSGWKNKKLMNLIAKTEGVKYFGYVDEVDKAALYSRASLFVFPSLYEGFGLPVLEAMASGVPVITSNRSSMPEVAGDAGYLVNPHNVVEIAEAMKMILSDNKLRDILVERGKKKTGEFVWKKSANEFVKLLNC